LLGLVPPEAKSRLLARFPSVGGESSAMPRPDFSPSSFAMVPSRRTVWVAG
jgi:hypothetical protein